MYEDVIMKSFTLQITHANKKKSQEEKFCEIGHLDVAEVTGIYRESMEPGSYILV